MMNPSSNDKISIIIPAHNEEMVIEGAITQLLPGVKKDLFEVIVVCNGCFDNTSKIVKSFGKPIICIETDVSSKTNALNIGEEVAKWFPRIYQDADVVLSAKAALIIAEVLRKGTFLAASPRMIMEYHNASWCVRSYYEIWQQLPYVQEGMVGTGVYALSEVGRKRFGKFPDIVADDGYIRSLFKPHERVLAECYSLVQSPRNLPGLIKIKTRSRRGGYELASKYPELMLNNKQCYGKAALKILTSIWQWPKVAIYVYVNMLSRILARRQFHKNSHIAWERDESSRCSNRSTSTM